MKAIIEKRLALQEKSGTVLLRGNELWAFGEKSRKLARYTGVGNRELRTGEPLPAVSSRDAALSWDGNNLLVADRTNRKVFRVNPAGGRETIVMDPDSLSFGDFDPALKGPGAIIADTAWYNSILYLAVQAGYSSAIYGIDLANNRVASYRPAPGPKPCGLDFNQADGSLYVVDNRNRELRRLFTDGKVDIASLPAEWEEPRGLSLESEKVLWSTDWARGDALRIRMEE